MKGSVGVRLRETELKTPGRTRCEFCVELKGSIEVRQSVEVKGNMKTMDSIEVEESNEN